MKGTVIVVTKPGLGSTTAGDAPFSMEMLDKFFHTLEKLSDKPAAICFYTEGVKVLAPDSPLTLSVRLLERIGVRIVACGSCLDYFGVTDICTGERSTMVEIVDLLSAANKVITV